MPVLGLITALVGPDFGATSIIGNLKKRAAAKIISIAD
jgi:hypothetical protein